MNITDILTTELINFIEDLRFAGYNIGTAQYIAAQDLILTLAAQGKLPSELSELRLFLAPILCHSPTEQAEFETYFNQWANQFNHTKISVDKKSFPDSVKPIIYPNSNFDEIYPNFSEIPSKQIPKTEPKKDHSKNNTKSLLDKIKRYNTLWKWVFIISTIVAVISNIVFYWSDISIFMQKLINM
jgi:uncharacterized protein with von Willebrand factor type A (vWA) domain